MNARITESSNDDCDKKENRKEISTNKGEDITSSLE